MKQIDIKQHKKPKIDSDIIRQQIEEFEKKGGSIQHIERGVSGEVHNPVSRTMSIYQDRHDFRPNKSIRQFARDLNMTYMKLQAYTKLDKPRGFVLETIRDEKTKIQLITPEEQARFIKWYKNNRG